MDGPEWARFKGLEETNKQAVEILAKYLGIYEESETFRAFHLKTTIEKVLVTTDAGVGIQNSQNIECVRRSTNGCYKIKLINTRLSLSIQAIALRAVLHCATGSPV
ncbi:MAG: hypothetical protein AAGA35_02865 [Patescibacteria group bacterium]